MRKRLRLSLREPLEVLEAHERFPEQLAGEVQESRLRVRRQLSASMPAPRQNACRPVCTSKSCGAFAAAGALLTPLLMSFPAALASRAMRRARESSSGSVFGAAGCGAAASERTGACTTAWP